MKNLLFSLILLLSGITALADNESCFIMGANDNIYFTSLNDSSYFTFGVNDTLLIHPSELGHYYSVQVKAHFIHRFDSWTAQFFIPGGLTGVHLEADTTVNSSLRVPYLDGTGTECIYNAVLTTNDTTVVASSTIPDQGFWDPEGDGIYSEYGTIKWEPGDYDLMFWLKFFINNSFRSGTVMICGEMISTYDERDGTTAHEIHYKPVTIIIGHIWGDVNGDGYIDTSDVTTLINIVHGSPNATEFQIAAADLNGDGHIDVQDVTMLIGWIMDH